MTIKELKELTTRLAERPTPTQEKKVYAFIGSLKELRQTLPKKVIVQGSLLDSLQDVVLPHKEMLIRALIQQHLSSHIEDLRRERKTSVVIITEAAIMARYRVPLTFLYNLTTDAHAIVLHMERMANTKHWKPPAYVRFDPAAAAKFFEETLGEQCLYSTRTDD